MTDEINEAVIYIEFVDDGADKYDGAILLALGKELEALEKEEDREVPDDKFQEGLEETEETMETVETEEGDENWEDDLPEAWDFPKDGSKVAIFVPNRADGTQVEK